MHPKTFHVVDRTAQPGDFEFAAVARAGINLANRERPSKETPDAMLERATDFNGRRVPGLQHFGHNPRFPNLPEQLHAALQLLKNESGSATRPVMANTITWFLTFCCSQGSAGTGRSG